MLPAMLRRLLHEWSTVLLPTTCLGCKRPFQPNHEFMPSANPAGVELASALQNAIAGAFCPRCRERCTVVASPLCTRCGLVFKSRTGHDHLCGRCLERDGNVTRARAAGIYDRSLRTAIHALKFKGQVTLARPLGALLWQAYRHHWPNGDIDLVAPVPLYRRRMRQRGFNQAYLLVRDWRLPAGTVIDRELLARTRDTQPQTGLDRRQRQSNIKNAFAVNHRGPLAGRRVLLVDDVLTTGATAEACAAVLMRSGAARVDVLTLARAL